MSNVPPVHELLGERAEDHRDTKACSTTSFTALGRGMKPYDWEDPARSIPSPPDVKNDQFTELRLAPNPAAAVAAVVIRQRAGSKQRSIISILLDAKQATIYRVRAPGVRLKDSRLDGRLVAGTAGLRLEGEQAQERLEDRALVGAGVGGPAQEEAESGASELWSTVEKAFEEESIAAIEFPDDSKHVTLKLDWPLVAEARRLRVLAKARIFRLEVIGTDCVRWRDFFSMKDVAGRSAGWRFAYYVAREAAYDAISVSRRNGLRDWLRFVVALLAFFSSLGSLGWLLSRIF